MILKFVKHFFTGCVFLLVTVNLCVAEPGRNPVLDPLANVTVVPDRTPKFDIRALQLTLRKSTGENDPVKQTKEDIIEIIQKASHRGFNVLLLKINGAIKFKQTPLFASKWSYSYNDIKEIVNFARKKGMEVVPAIELLTHQEMFIKEVNSKLMKNSTDYDPRKQEVYKIVFNVLDEIIKLFQPKYIHIGHDEAYGISGYRHKMRIDLPMLTPEDYLFDILEIHRFLNKKGIRTMIWADMLLDPSLYAEYYDREEINGYMGFAGIVDRLPRDIILCDWHYVSKRTEFPSYTDFQKKGFTVWGAVWSDLFTIHAYSNYVEKYAHENEGMIATTWWISVSQDKEILDLILETASKAFFQESVPTKTYDRKSP